MSRGYAILVVDEDGEEEFLCDGLGGTPSRFPSRAASAMIAKIPLPLAQHIARCFHPGCASCGYPVAAGHALCDNCLRRGHRWPECPSPGKACTCGFSKLFWLDVRAGTELSVESQTITAVNVSSTPLVTPAPMTAGSALNPFPGMNTVGFCRSCAEPLADEAILAIHLAAGHEIGEAQMPDSGEKVTGSEGPDGFCPGDAAQALAASAECGRM